MIFEISFPLEGADKASVLAQETRLAFLQNGANPKKVEIVKQRADTMDLGATIQLALDVYHASAPVLENIMPALTVAHCARILYEICAPAHSGIRIKTPSGAEVELTASEISFERLRQVFEAANNDEPISRD
jgi:hypothetical protein